MNTRSVVYLVLICLGSIGIGYIATRIQTPCADFTEGKLTTPTTILSLAIVETPEEQARGLGGCTYIPAQSGMYFPMDSRGATVFWMKDMLIPIDIVWIRDGEVVGIEHGVPNEPVGTLESDLKRYPSPGEIDGVLEIEAEKAKEYGIENGAQVILTK